MEVLAGLKPVFRPDGTVTAGNACPLNDGAAAVLVMSEERAGELGVTPRARIVASTVAAIRPEIMGLGPIPAVKAVLEQAGMSLDDIDIVEINEAFASVVLAWELAHKGDMERVNPNGGAIALGHPLGGTGAILTTKAVHELQRSDTEHAIVTMCCGGGLGTGTLLRRG